MECSGALRGHSEFMVAMVCKNFKWLRAQGTKTTSFLLIYLVSSRDKQTVRREEVRLD